jgi:hypothetical protein
MKTAEEVLKIIAEKMVDINNLQKQNTLQLAESKSPL